jgi:membrane-associated phospholipid phosphatase
MIKQGFSMERIKSLVYPSLTMRRRLWPVALGACYILTIAALGGLRWTHVAMGALSLLDIWNERSRRFLKIFFPVMATGIVFDTMRYYYWAGVEGNIRVEEPYLIEKSLFGIFDSGKGMVVTPNEYFENRIWVAADLLCGFAYLTFVAEYLTGAFVLYFMRKFTSLIQYTWSFFVVNLMGFVTYFIYPAAPPWYITLYGFGPARMDVKPNAAAAVRFDEILGTQFFTAMYGEGIDVYGSIPSLHVSYPFIAIVGAVIATRGLRTGLRASIIGLATCFYLLVCFAAVYLQHHYVIDVVLGTLYAVAAMIIVRVVYKAVAAYKIGAGSQRS